MMTIWRVKVGVVALAIGAMWGYSQEEAPVLVPTDKRHRVPEVAPAAPVAESQGEPWLGVVVSKASSAVLAQLRDIPRGVGFLIDEVSFGGPAEKAGLRRHDVLWKMDEQLLVNESQFLTLLGLRKPGEAVRLTYFRGGENLEVEAVLAARPESETGRQVADVALVTPAASTLPMRILNVEDRVAVLSDETGTVSIQRDEKGYDWAMIDPDGKVMAGGIIAGGTDEEIPSTVQQPLRGKLKALVRSLEEVEKQRRVRAPRLRRVPVPTEAR